MEAIESATKSLKDSGYSPSTFVATPKIFGGLVDAFYKWEYVTYKNEKYAYREGVWFEEHRKEPITDTKLLKELNKQLAIKRL